MPNYISPFLAGIDDESTDIFCRLIFPESGYSRAHHCQHQEVQDNEGHIQEHAEHYDAVLYKERQAVPEEVKTQEGVGNKVAGFIGSPTGCQKVIWVEISIIGYFTMAIT